MKRPDLFTDREFYGKLWHIAMPIAFQNLMLAAVAAADTFMLGSVEQNAMSAVSLASQIQFIQNMILSAATGVCGILGAQYWGKEDRATVGDVFCMTLRLCAAVSLLFFAGCVFFPEMLMRIFTDQPELISIGADYLRVAGWSYLLTGISQCYLAVMKVSDHAGRVAQISTGAVLLNILLNAVFIFGWFGLPAMGVIGAATATLIARAAELGASVLFSARPGYIRPTLKGLLRRPRLLAGDFYRCLMPLLGACLLWGIGFTSYTAFMGHLGTDAAAANSVAAVIRDLICCLCNGLAAGGGIMVGNELGAGNPVRGRQYGDRLMKLSWVCGLASTLLMLALTPLILHSVRLTEEASSLMVWMMVIMAVYMIGRSVNTVIINGIFAAGGDTLFDMYSLAVCMWGLAVPLAAAGTFLFHWPVPVIYACTCLDEVGKIPWVMAHYRKYKWVRDLTRADVEG